MKKMAIVKKPIRTGGKVPLRRPSPVADVVTLPTEKYTPSGSLGDYPILIYGERKIGKTTLASQFPMNMFLCFEPNDSYELYKRDIQNWEDFTSLASQLLKKGTHKFKTVTIDTGELSYQSAFEHACIENEFKHPQDAPYGKGWAAIRSTFYPPMLNLMKSSLGFIVICHEKEKEIETRGGRVFLKMCPDLSKQSDSLYTAQIYNIFYYFFEDGERWLQILGDDYITAGHRMKGHFLTPTGERVHKIPMGDSEEEGYKNLMDAFNNKQKKSYAPEEIEEKPKTAVLKKKVSTVTNKKPLLKTGVKK